MRRARLTYPGAYHHIMNRGINGEPIFKEDENKRYFLKVLKEKSALNKIKILAYCIMDNHYHLIIQNTTNRLSFFMKHLNAAYGTYYRVFAGGEGYVFQNRYKSTLVQKDTYMTAAIGYILMNPVWAGITDSPYAYRWSSIRAYFIGGKDDITENGEVEELFGDRTSMMEYLQGEKTELKADKTRMGMVMGDEEFIRSAFARVDRRKETGKSGRMRVKDYSYKKPDNVIREFENETGRHIDEIDTGTWEGKRQRVRLLVLLRDMAGKSYREILELPLFKGIKYGSMAKLYKTGKERLLQA